MSTYKLQFKSSRMRMQKERMKKQITAMMTAIKYAHSKDWFIVNRILAPRLNVYNKQSSKELFCSNFTPITFKYPLLSFSLFAFQVFIADNERQHSAFTLSVYVGSKISHFNKKKEFCNLIYRRRISLSLSVWRVLKGEIECSNCYITYNIFAA